MAGLLGDDPGLVQRAGPVLVPAVRLPHRPVPQRTATLPVPAGQRGIRRRAQQRERDQAAVLVQHRDQVLPQPGRGSGRAGACRSAATAPVPHTAATRGSPASRASCRSSRRARHPPQQPRQLPLTTVQPPEQLPAQPRQHTIPAPRPHHPRITRRQPGQELRITSTQPTAGPHPLTASQHLKTRLISHHTSNQHPTPPAHSPLPRAARHHGGHHGQTLPSPHYHTPGPSQTPANTPHTANTRPETVIRSREAAQVPEPGDQKPPVIPPADRTAQNTAICPHGIINACRFSRHSYSICRESLLRFGYVVWLPQSRESWACTRRRSSSTITSSARGIRLSVDI